MGKSIYFDDWLKEQMQDPEFEAAMEILESGYQVARARIQRAITQRELADLIGAPESVITQLENGEREPSLLLLRKIAQALHTRLVISFETESALQSARHAAMAYEEWKVDPSSARPYAEFRAELNNQET